MKVGSAGPAPSSPVPEFLLVGRMGVLSSGIGARFEDELSKRDEGLPLDANPPLLLPLKELAKTYIIKYNLLPASKSSQQQYCIVFEHLYSASHSIKPHRSAFQCN